jgi:adenosylcobinamide-phosphate synthase
MIFGEFDKVKFYKHPIIFIGNFIKWFENNFYDNSVVRGYYLVLFLLFFMIIIAFILTYILPIWLIGIIASMTISSKMLHDKVKDIIQTPSNIKYLVSRDTTKLSQSDINKAAIETYAENLNDGVIAPIFYLLFFGLYGVFIYKTINTLDSMVGYRDTRYEKFGKVSAILDDILNFIPSKITALLISFLMLNKKSFLNIFKYGYLHESPNAGFPISAMAGVCDISLGGNTSYFGKIKKKSYFGDGTKIITINHIQKALTFNIRLDILIIIYLGVLIVISKLV